MTQEETRCVDYFGQRAESWYELYRTKASFRARLALFSRELRRHVPPPATILDYGCGSGAMSLFVAKMGYKVVGMDASPHMIEVAQMRRAECGIDNARFLTIEPTSCPAEPESFDAVICSSVIEYVEKDIALVVRLVHCLKEGGVLLVSFPHSGSLQGGVEDLFKKRFGLLEGRKDDLLFSRRRYDCSHFEADLKAMHCAGIRRSYFQIPFLGSLRQIPFLAWMATMTLVSARKEPRFAACPAVAVRPRRRAQWAQNTWRDVVRALRHIRTRLFALAGLSALGESLPDADILLDLWDCQVECLTAVSQYVT